MKIGDRRRKILGLVLAGLVIGLSLACVGDNGDTDYSGTYYLTLEGLPNGTIVIEQSGDDVTFAMETHGKTIEGTGTVSGNIMTLTGEVYNMGVMTVIITFSDDGQSFSGTLEIAGDNPVQESITGSKQKWATYDVDASGIPQFATVEHIELEKIYRISKFRSGVGHDYSDDFESCRSMKHYFNPKGDVDWSGIKVFSPVDGTVAYVTGEQVAGMQVGIKSKEHPAFYFIVFHVNPDGLINTGDAVTAGQELGTHFSSETMSDITVKVYTPNGWKLVSYFDVMTDSLFEHYQARSISSRDDVIISKEARDADPLACDGEKFVDSGNLENWVVLN